MSQADNPILKVRRLTPTATIPTKGSPDAAGWDLYADGLADTIFIRNQQAIISDTPNAVSTGIAVAIPKGYYGRIASRSGLASRGVHVVGGVVDSDYRGEIRVLLVCTSPGFVYRINQFDRIAQLIIEKISLGPIIEVEDLDETSRGDKGFGSTGI